MALSAEEKQKIAEEEAYRAKTRSEVQTTTYSSKKDKFVAGVLALFLGTLGIHKFYLGKTGSGLVYLLLSIFFFWTIVIPVILALIALIEAIMIFTSSDEEFHRKYNKA